MDFLAFVDVTRLNNTEETSLQILRLVRIKFRP